MNILERMEDCVKALVRDGIINSQNEVEIYVTGYLRGLRDQETEEWCRLSDTDYIEIQEHFKGYLLKPFYFTFGSYEGFPYQNGYMVVMAEDIRQAARKFMRKYPNKRDSETVNCSDYYSAESWERRTKQYYADMEPFEILR